MKPGAYELLDVARIEEIDLLIEVLDRSCGLQARSIRTYPHVVKSKHILGYQTCASRSE